MMYINLFITRFFVGLLLLTGVIGISLGGCAGKVKDAATCDGVICDLGTCKEGVCVNPADCEINNTCKPEPCDKVICERGLCERSTGQCVSKSTCTTETDCIDGQRCFYSHCLDQQS